MKKKNILLLVIVIILIAVFYIYKKEKIVPATSTAVSETAPTETEKKLCYFRETKNDTTSDLAFTSILYKSNDTVSGVINSIPGEQESLVGTYTGVLEPNNDMKGYPLRMNIVYKASGDGIISQQQEIIIIASDHIETGTGEKYQDEQGVYRFKDTNKLKYINSLPLVDCSIVPENASKDYLAN